MPHYYQGQSEADFVIRTTPQMVDFWLNKARRDRRRWAVRILRPHLRQFLDGFIAGLDAYARGEGGGDAPSPAVPAAVAAPAPAVPAASRESPRRDAPPPPPPEAEPRPARLPERVEASEPVRVPEPARVPEPRLDLERLARPEKPTDGDRAIGVFRLSGWSVGQTADGGENAAPPDQVIRGRGGEPLRGPHGPAPTIVWNNALEQGRAMGVVDLSAYDMLDHLDELRELFERREYLREGRPGPDGPRGR